MADYQADIHWRDALPISNQFDDVYYSSDGGLDESRHTFIDHSFLQQRWQDPQTPLPYNFCIGETGFGTGLNFLLSWQLWQRQQPGGQLHFISIEKYPLSADDLRRAHLAWPELANLSQALRRQYPAVLSRGLHTIQCSNKVFLHLIFDDVLDGLERVKHSQHPAFASHNRIIDAWYLDGFTPKKNPAMWCRKVLADIAELSKPKASFATFTAASQVRRDLQELGFECHKASGFGLKRELLYGQLPADLVEQKRLQEQALQGKAESFNSPFPAPWYLKQEQPQVKTAAIIGGGIAACLSAYALSQQGIKVTLVEANAELAQAGSGNPQAVIYGKLSHREESLSQYNLLALQFAHNFYRPLIAEGKISGDLCGLIQLSLNDKLYHNHQKLIDYLRQNNAQADWCQHLSGADLSAIAGVEIQQPGLYFPTLGWLEPKSLCEYLVQAGDISLCLGRHVAELKPLNNGWGLVDERQQCIAEADVVVIANAHSAKQFKHSQELPLKPVRGQITLAPSQHKPLHTVLCGEGYIAPAHQQQHCLGASFRPNNESCELSSQEQRENLQLLARDMPAVYHALGGDAGLMGMADNGRAAIRATTPDYLPLVGPVPQVQAMQQRFALLSKNAKANISQAGCYYPGLYTACGFGSRGMSYGPLAAVHLASVITASAPVLESSLAQQLNPARFLIRNLKRKTLIKKQ